MSVDVTHCPPVAGHQACGRRLDRVEAEEDAPEEERGAAVSAYYHFDSRSIYTYSLRVCHV